MEIVMTSAKQYYLIENDGILFNIIEVICLKFFLNNL